MLLPTGTMAALSRPRLRFWLTLFGQLTLLFVVGEIAARLVLDQKPNQRLDPRYGVIPLGDQLVVHSSEGFSRSRTNRFGHFDSDTSMPARADGVLVVGDSFTEARQVPLSARFTERLQVETGRPVYNVGHSGWSPVNASAFLEAETANFAPSATFVQISGNDVADFFDKRRLRLREVDGSFQIDSKQRPLRVAGWRRLVRHSVLAESLIMAGAAVLFSGDGEAGDAGGNACERMTDKQARAARWVVGQLARAPIPPALLYLPSLDYRAGCRDVCVVARNEFALAALDAGIAFIDTTPGLCAAFERTGQPANGFWNTRPGTGHLNELGHRVVAETIAHYLERAGR